MAISPLFALRTVFIALGCVMVAILIYTISIDGLPFRKDLLTPWMIATLIDYYINVGALAVWVSYKETSWLTAAVWVVLLVFLGSITTCAYITVQLFKLSDEESAQDLMRHLLLQKCDMNASAEKRNSCKLVTARLVFSALGCIMLGTLIYTCASHGSPFNKENFIPWLNTTLVDFYINVVALLVWVGYKESSWVGKVAWITFLICLGRKLAYGLSSASLQPQPPCLFGHGYDMLPSNPPQTLLLAGYTDAATCAYITWELFQLSSCDPLHLALLNKKDRAGSGYEKPTGITTL